MTEAQGQRWAELGGGQEQIAEKAVCLQSEDPNPGMNLTSLRPGANSS